MNGNTQIYTDSDTINFLISNLVLFYPISLLLYFYSVSFLHYKKLFNILLFISSTSTIILSFMFVARGDTVYWALMYIFLFALFRKNIDITKRKKILLPFYIAIVLGSIYFSFITIARFKYFDQGIIFSILDYWGQPAINFGIIFDNYFEFQSKTLNFPFFQRVLGMPFRDGVSDYFKLAYADSGTTLSVFYTFIGSLYIDFGTVGTFLIVSSISFLGFRLFKKSKQISMCQLLLMILYCQIPLQGLFIFNLLNDNGNKYILFIFLLSFLFSFKFDHQYSGKKLSRTSRYSHTRYKTN